MLSKPFGPVLSPKDVVVKIIEERPQLLIVIGDESLHKMLMYGIMPDVCVYDRRVKRKSAPQEWLDDIKRAFAGKEIINVKNPAGEIREGLVFQIKECIKNGEGIIEVEGEEDLAALPSLAYAPAGAIILYGQPNDGVVYLEVNEEGKKNALVLLKKLKNG